MRTLTNKLLLTSASALSILGLTLAVPHAANAQEMNDDLEMEAAESVEMEADTTEVVEDDNRLGQSVEMESVDMDADATDMDSDDIDSDLDYDDDDSEIEAETYSAPTYSNSPRALW